MSESLPDRLARKAFPEAVDRAERCAVAIRTALDEAATVAREHEIVLDDSPFAKWTTKGGRFAQQIAAAIEALAR